MPPERARRQALLRATRAIWRELRPGETIGRGRAVKRAISINSARGIGPGLRFATWAQFLSLFGPPWTLGVRGGLADARVGHLRHEVQGLNNDIVLDFDVLAASDFLDGVSREWKLPSWDPHGPESKTRELLAFYSEALDRIWQSVGGYTVEGFQSLALWSMRHRMKTGVGGGDIAMACRAYIYGDRALSLELLGEFESGWARSVREDPRNQARHEVHAEIKIDIAKLRQIVLENRPWMH